MNRIILLSWLLWIVGIFVLTCMVVFLTVGSLMGSTEIGIVPMGPAILKSKDGVYEGGYKIDAKALTGSLITKLPTLLEESDFQALLQLPLRMYNKKICGRIEGFQYASVRVVFDPGIEIIVGNPNVDPCKLYIDEGKLLFPVSNPKPSLARLIDGEEQGYFAYLESLSETRLLNLPDKAARQEKYSNKLHLTLELASSLYFIYLVSFLFVLGLISLIHNNLKIMMEHAPKFMKNAIKYISLFTLIP